MRHHRPRHTAITHARPRSNHTLLAAGTRKLVAVLLCATVCLLTLLGAGARVATATEASSQLKFYTDDDNGNHFSAEGGAVAYCMDPDTPGPSKSGTTYTRLERATGVVAYIVYHGYPNNLTICGVPFSSSTIGIKNAEVTTNMAIWTYQRNHAATKVTACGLASMNEAGSKLLAEAQAWAKSAANNSSAPENNSTWIYAPPSGSGKQRMLLPGKEEVVKKGSLSLTKVSAQPALTSGNACYSLAGATYDVFADKGLSKKVGTLTTKADGTANVIGALPEGTYYAKETKAPVGFKLSKSVYEAEVKADATSVISAADEPIFCHLDTLVQKVDAETGQATPQGDASLADAEFLVGYWDNTDGSTAGSPKRSWVMRTDSQGKVPLDKDHLVSGDELYLDAEGKAVLPVGTISISETSAPEGYRVANGEAQVQVITSKDGKLDRAFVTAEFKEEVCRGGLAVSKISRETAGYLEQGQSKLEGATFSVTLLSPGPVVVDGKTYTTGQTVASITAAWEGEACIARTSQDALPYGTYLVKESSVPASSGVLLNKDWAQTVQIREDNSLVDLATTQDACPNQVVRGNLTFVKRNGTTAGAMAGIPFTLSSLTTGETHVIVTDENGVFDSSAVPHSAITNANDAALSTDGSIDDSLLDPAAGVWFSGRADLTVETDDSLGALPYDRYVLRELPCKANENMQLVETNLTVQKDARTIDWGTIDDQPTPTIYLATELVGNNKAHAISASSNDLVDTVFYDGLTTGEQYVLVGTLHVRLADGTDGGALTDTSGNPYVQTHPFTAHATSGSEEMAFAVDASQLAGKSIVCFEELYAGSAEGEPIATHTDIASAEQSVTVVGLATSATNVTDGTQEVCAAADAKVVDLVTYTGLEANGSYTLCGSLHLKAQDGSDLGPLCDEKGNAICASQEFVAHSSDGEVSVNFGFDASGLGGCTVVAFEQLVDAQGNTIARHEDISDQGQTIRIPALSTTARSNEADQKDGSAPAKHTVVDTVTYRNLTPGTAYVLTATLHGRAEDGTDQGPITTKDGKPVTAQKTITCEEADGQTEISLDLEAAPTDAPAAVVFEELTREADSATIASHADIGATSQTVRFPQVSTTLTDAADGDHAIATGTVKVVDEVSYHGLTAGTEYTVEGTIHVRKQDGSDAGPLKDSSGKPVTSTKTFVAEASDGTVSLAFSFDSGLLEGNPAVAFEVIRLGDDRIAAHEDISSQSQTVTPSAEPVKPASTPVNDSKASLLPQTGRFPIAYLLAGGGFTVAGAAMASLVWQRRHPQAGPRPRRRRHYTR